MSSCSCGDEIQYYPLWLTVMPVISVVLIVLKNSVHQNCVGCSSHMQISVHLQL